MYRFVCMAVSCTVLAPTFFGLDALVKPVAVPPPLEHSAAEGVHDEHVLVTNDVLLDDTKREGGGEKAYVSFETPQQEERHRSVGWWVNV